MQATLWVEEAPKSGAVISDDGLYRYLLWRIWDAAKPLLGAILTNPSKADGETNDPTVLRLVERGKRLDFGGLYLANPCAYRATSPADMLAAPDPVGPENDQWLRYMFGAVDRTLVGWGVNVPPWCVERVLSIARECGAPLYCLGKTKDGQPRHPLYISYETPMEAWQ